MVRNTAPAEQPVAGNDVHSRSVEWYAEGQARTVEVAGVQITVRFVGRKGRRGRIAIIAPPGAAFSNPDDSASARVVSIPKCTIGEPSPKEIRQTGKSRREGHND